ncbi:MAG: hypothetical protein K2Q14_08680, partial [Gammaproteobacteria bacterium]|nr:hypothetical protein [Gammaproteobacteria bacterium]
MDKSHINNLHEQIKHVEADFLEFIRQRLGIVIHSHQKSELYNTLIEACQKFDLTPRDYLQVLKNGSNDCQQLVHLVAGITIGETYFFRDNNQMQLLQEHLLPEIIQLKRKQGEYSLRMWSAACSSGEDIYTIAMMLCELLPDYKKWTLQLMGTDINMSSLHKARAGRYGQWSMRTITDYYKDKYFTVIGNQFQLSLEIMNLVRFAYLNLNENSYPSILNGTNAQDLIVCCNVLIYFDNVSIANLMKKLANSLVPGGFLLLGASDPVILTDTSLIHHHAHGLYFSRPMVDEIKAIPIERKPPKPVYNIITPTHRVKTPHVAQTPVVPDTHVDTARISSFMGESRWQDALSLIERY